MICKKDFQQYWWRWNVTAASNAAHRAAHLPELGEPTKKEKEKTDMEVARDKIDGTALKRGEFRARGERRPNTEARGSHPNSIGQSAGQVTETGTVQYLYMFFFLSLPLFLYCIPFIYSFI